MPSLLLVLSVAWACTPPMPTEPVAEWSLVGRLGNTDLESQEGTLVPDTVLPPIPSLFPPPDTAFAIVSADGDTFFRRQFVVVFPDSVTGAMVNSFLADWGGVIVGGNGENVYYIQVADPGTDWDTYTAFADSLGADPRIEIGAWWPVSGGMGISGQFPTDAAWNRDDWFSQSDDDTSAQWAVRTLDFESREGTLVPVLRPVLAQDTVLPPIPSLFPPPDTAFAILSPTGETFFRRLFVVVFPDSVTGAMVNSFLADWGGVIVGGNGRDRYYIQVADPGTDWATYVTFVTSPAADPRIEIGAWWPVTGGMGISGQFPTDAAWNRDDWFSQE